MNARQRRRAKRAAIRAMLAIPEGSLLPSGIRLSRNRDAYRARGGVFVTGLELVAAARRAAARGSRPPWLGAAR